jgi:FlaA1/EpsC-like NDP-sugar epimerase
MKMIFNRILLNRWIAVLHDLMMVPVAWLLAYWLRFNLSEISPQYMDAAFLYLLIVMPVQASVFWVFGLYRGVWRFASIPDLLRIFKSVAAGVAASILLIYIFDRMEWLPRSVPVFYGMLLVFLLGGPRFIYRWLKDHHLTLKAGKRVLIVGAGSAGEMLARDLLRNPESTYLPVAFVDDKVRRIGQDIHGIPIAGDTDSIPELSRSLGIEVIVLAIPSASVAQRKHLIELC